METNMSSMDYTQSNWSKVVFNDTKELAKKQSQNGTSGYSRRLFSKMKRTSTPAKQRLRSNIYHKHLARSKQTSSVQTKATNKLTENIVNDRKPENEVWNMIQQYRLVPTIENLAVVNNSIEKTYKFIENAIDINNNGNESHITLNEQTDRTSSIDNTYSDTTYEDADDRTITNTSSLSWEYSDFQNDISPEAASTFISEEKENIPFMAAPRKVPSNSITFFDSPVPSFAKGIQKTQKDRLSYQMLANLCGKIRANLVDALKRVNNLEAHCILMMNNSSSYTDEYDHSLSGFDLLSFNDSMEFYGF